MNRRAARFLGSAAAAAFSFCVAPAFGLPTFQAYINDAVAGSSGPDEQTWFFPESDFELYIVGAYGSMDLSISSVTLLISVPDGETGTIYITPSGGDETPILITTSGGVTGSPLNPTLNADLDVLTDVAGLDGYATKDFLPDGVTFNNHYPFQEGVSDFILFDLAAFDKSDTGSLNDYNADDGTITAAPNAEGEQKEYTVSFTGFSQVHFDVYGYIMTDDGAVIRTTWDINPGSHDSTAVPAPGALALGLMGFALVGWARRGRV